MCTKPSKRRSLESNPLCQNSITLPAACKCNAPIGRAELLTELDLESNAAKAGYLLSQARWCWVIHLCQPSPPRCQVFSSWRPSAQASAHCSCGYTPYRVVVTWNATQSNGVPDNHQLALDLPLLCTSALLGNDNMLDGLTFTAHAALGSPAPHN